ncbi:MAG: alpha/beta fold hydrolase [Frankiaceae bacterium]
MSTTTGAALREESVELWNGRLTMKVKVAGSGPDLVFLHPTSGPAWVPLLSHLAERFTVHLPELPGTSAGDPYAVHVIDELPDLVLAYEEMTRRLGLTRPVLVGHSFGGMLAAELAAHFPSLPERLILMDSLGLWRDDIPVVNLATTPPEQVPAMLFADPSGPVAQAVLKPPDDPDQARAAMVARVWAMASSGKYLWPIPDRGLRGRLHRIAASTLLLWGREDRVVPVEHADEFAGLIPDSKVAVVEGAGHLPHLEKGQQTATLVDEFLG